MESTIKHIIIDAEVPKGVTIGDLSRKYPEISFNITNGHWISEDERIWRQFLLGHSSHLQ